MHKPTSYRFLGAGPLCLALLLSRPAAASWPSDPGVNVPLCVANHDQYSPMIVPDGSGGAIVAWYDYRNIGTNIDIYAQRVSASGTPMWGTGGVAVCTAPEMQVSPVLASDGAGGAIIVWNDFRSTTSWDVYAQRISAAGAVQWTPDGVALCTVDGHQFVTAIAADGAGGAIATWYDRRNGYSNDDVYAQRVSAVGSPQWTADGVPVGTAPGDQHAPALLADGAGGAMVTWQDARDYPFHWSTCAQKLSAAGVPQWTPDGVILSTAISEQLYPEIVSDGGTGAIVTWQDTRSGNPNVYAQRVSTSGAVQWATNGVPICTANGYEYYPELVPDGAGGAIITWYDYRFGNWDIYAQRVSNAGAIQWTASGLVVCPYYNNQQSPTIVSDGAGGAIITWMDERVAAGISDLYAQRISPNGAAQWAVYGIPLSSAAGNQSSPMSVTDGSGGVIVTWMDSRGTDLDIYAQRMLANGTLGGGVTDVRGPTTLAFALDPVSPNPTRGGVFPVRFTLASAGAASLELVDVAGRRVATRDAGALGAGPHALDFDAGRRLAPGVYLVRLRQGVNERATRLVVLQ